MYRMIRRRKRSAETDYKSRIALLKGGLPRIVVRRSNRSITMQVVEYTPDYDRIVAQAHSSELRKMGWEPRCNLPTAYLTGTLLAKRWNGESVLDIGLYKPVKGSVVFAAAKGAIDSGMKLKANIDLDAARAQGAHIESYAKAGATFKGYSKAGFDPSSMQAKFEAAKKKILSGA